MQELNRRDFLKGSLAVLGFAALPRGFLFAAPAGWKPSGRPNLVFGVMSDSHLRTDYTGLKPSRSFTHKYVIAAFEYFKSVGVNMGIGHEPNGGVTTLEIPKAELPPGKALTFAVRPLTSLGTFGKAISTTFLRRTQPLRDALAQMG